MRDLLTEAEAAKILKMRPEGLRALRRKEAGPPWHRVGKFVRYFAEDVEEWVRRQ